MISVVMPSHNGERTIGRSIRSVLDQTHRDFELLVVDNASTDRTAEVVMQAAAGDPRVRIVAEPIRGVAAARNRGLAEARFPWIAVNDDDDVSHPERFAVLLARAARDPRLVIVGGWALCFDEDAGMRDPFHHATSDALIRIQMRNGPCPFVASTVLFCREAALAAGAYTDEFAGSDDYCLWARLRNLGRMANVPRHLALYRHRDPRQRPEYARAQAEATQRLKARYFEPISRFEDWRLRFHMRGAREKAQERIAIDWPPALLERYGLREIFARRSR
jgi:glycosyltransferase involved in cell wall biosynthesis